LLRKWQTTLEDTFLPHPVDGRLHAEMIPPTNGLAISVADVTPIFYVKKKCPNV